MREPPLEVVAGGVAQIAVFAAGFGLLKYHGAGFDAVTVAGVVIAVWIVAAIASTATYFVASSWLAGPAVDGGDLT